MKKYFLNLGIFLIFVLLAISCQKDDNPSDPQNNPDFTPLPLKVGNFWTFSSTTLYGNSEYTVSCIGTTDINGQTVYVFSDNQFFSKDGFFYTDGNLIGLDINSSLSAPEIVFPKNLAVGQSWTLSSGKTIKLEEINKSVTVPSGTFNCYKLLYPPAGGIQYYVYWSNGIGPVKAIDKNNPSIKDELISYAIN